MVEAKINKRAYALIEMKHLSKEFGLLQVLSVKA